jgi:hypothetical protein
MKRKPLKIDWDELESAFQAKSEDLVYYLDLVTGQVVLDGEGEERASDSGDDDDDDDLERLPVPVVRAETTRLYVRPPEADEELDWIETFAEQEGGLDHVLDAEDVHDGFRDALRRDPERKERWFAFRSDRLHERIDRWIADNGVHPAEPPPWR